MAKRLKNTYDSNNIGLEIESFLQNNDSIFSSQRQALFQANKMHENKERIRKILIYGSYGFLLLMFHLIQTAH